MMMAPDRAEMAGTGLAIVFHVALIAALSTSLAAVSRPSEPPAMEVELVEDVGLQSASPEPSVPPPLYEPHQQSVERSYDEVKPLRRPCDRTLQMGERRRG